MSPADIRKLANEELDHFETPQVSVDKAAIVLRACADLFEAEHARKNARDFTMAQEAIVSVRRALWGLESLKL